MQKTKTRRAGLALAVAIALGSFGAPLAAQADAAVTKLRTFENASLLTYVDTGVATMKFASEMSALPNSQRWDEVKSPKSAAAVFYVNVQTGKCLRAHPTNNFFVRAITCDFSGTSDVSKQQQWIHNGNGEMVNLDRFNRNIPERALTANFNVTNRPVGLARFTNTPNQRWIELGG